MKEKITLKKTVLHLLTISKHKAYVAEECFKVGLYRQGLAHDLSKYSPSEFFVGARYYQGNRSPNNAEREDKGYSSIITNTGWIIRPVPKKAAPAASFPRKCPEGM